MAQSHTALRASAAHQGEDICPAPCSGFFRLTPALFPGERVNPSLRGEQSRPAGFPLRDVLRSLSLRERSGWGESACRSTRRLGPFPKRRTSWTLRQSRRLPPMTMKRRTVH